MNQLAELPVGQRARVHTIHGGDRLAHRLQELGFRSDVGLTMVRRAPLGGPIIVALHGSDVMLRRHDAERILVETLAS